MGSLHEGDEILHHQDNSHRWIAIRAEDQEAWTARVRDHVAEHQRTQANGRVSYGLRVTRGGS